MPNPSGEYVLKIIAAKTESGAESGQHTSGGLMSATSMARNTIHGRNFYWEIF